MDRSTVWHSLELARAFSTVGGDGMHGEAGKSHNSNMDRDCDSAHSSSVATLKDAIWLVQDDRIILFGIAIVMPPATTVNPKRALQDIPSLWTVNGNLHEWM